MKLRKRALSLLLVLACMISLVSAAFAYSSFDQFMAAQGRLPGVDYTRIKQDTQRAIKIGFEIGSKHFRGVLARGKKLDNATTDEIIRRVMDFHELTTNKLVDLRSDVEFAKTQREPFDANYWLEAAGQLLHLNNLVKAADVAQGKLSGADYCRQYLESKPMDTAVDLAVSGAGLTGLPAFIATGLAGVGSATIDEFLYMRKYDAIMQKALDAAIKLDQFYADCNALLQKEADKQDEKWRLTAFKSPDKEDRVLFGVTVTQLWEFSCSLEKESGGNGPDEFWGEYAGVMTVDITHNMRRFDSNFLWDVANELPIMTELQSRNPLHSFYDTFEQPTTLTKGLAAADIRIYIPPNAAGAKPDSLITTIDLGAFQTKSSFRCAHPIWMVPDGVIPFLDDEGKYQFNFTGGYMEGQAGTEMLISGRMPDGLCPEIYMEASTMHLWGEVSAAQAHNAWDNSKLNDGATFRTNTDIFRDLASGTIVVRAGWKEDRA